MKSTSRSRKNSAAASRPESPADTALCGAAGLGLEALETRVQSAIEEIERLRRENAELRKQNSISGGGWAKERDELRQRVSSLVERLEELASVEGDS